MLFGDRVYGMNLQPHRCGAGAGRRCHAKGSAATAAATADMVLIAAVLPYLLFPWPKVQVEKNVTLLCSAVINGEVGACLHVRRCRACGG